MPSIELPADLTLHVASFLDDDEDWLAWTSTCRAYSRDRSDGRNYMNCNIQRARLLRDVFELGKSVFLQGAAGTGKSYLIRTVKRIADESVAITASTGMAASHLEDGCTIHSLARLGIAKHISGAERMAASISLTELQAITYLVIDEISMIRADFFDLLNERCKRARRCRLPFGGLIVILVGDFLQLPPVVKDDEGVSPDYVYAFQSRAWQELDPVRHDFTFNHRQRGCAKIRFLLARIRMGRIDETVMDIIKSRIVPREKIDGSVDEQGFCVPWLLPYNAQVDRENNRRLLALGDDAFKTRFVCTDQFVQKQPKSNAPPRKMEPEECVQLRKPAGIEQSFPSSVRLYEGGQYVLTQNVNVAAGLYNGAIMILRGDEFVFRGRAEPIKVEELAKYTRMFLVDRKRRIYLTRKGIPANPAYALSIHKSQGMTLDRVVMSLSASFAASLGYTGISRARELNSVYFVRDKVLDPESLRIDQTALEFVNGTYVSKLKPQKRIRTEDIFSITH